MIFGRKDKGRDGKAPSAAQPGRRARRQPPLAPAQAPPPGQPPPQPILNPGRTGPATGIPRSPAELIQPTRPPRPPRNHRPRARRRRLHPALRIVNGLLTLSLLVMMGAGAGAMVARQMVHAPGPLQRTSIVAIPRGTGVNGIAALLEQQGVISDRRLFVANVYYRGAQSGLKAGEYQIEKLASIDRVVDTLIEGRAIMQKFTAVEGLTSLQIIERLRKDENLQGDIKDIPPEGSLLPDTYRFTRGMTRADLIGRMQEDQKKFLDRMWQTRQEDLPFKTKEEALILASIVEKETGQAGERALVAAAFVNRLRKGMKLQSDPTIIYGLVQGQGSLGRPIKRSEINQKTAYNTYQIDGMPPTPICNPGRSAIEATLNPAKSDVIYFVADGTGGHAFARTLKEHNQNVANWRKIEKAMRDKQTAETAAQDKTAETAPAAAVVLPVRNSSRAERRAAAKAKAQAQAKAGAAPKLKIISGSAADSKK